MSDYRDLAKNLLIRDIGLRYKQTLLGPIWVVLQPLLAAGVFTFVFGDVAKVPKPAGVPYFAYALVGMAMWTGFSQGIIRATSSLLTNTDLITKVYFPRAILPASGVLSASLDCLIMLVLATITTAVGTGSIRPQVLIVIPLMFATLILAGSLGAGLAAVLVRFRDVQYGLPAIVQALLFLTPVLYPASSLPTSVEKVSKFDPLANIFETLRWAYFGTSLPAASHLLCSLAVLFGLSAFGLGVFNRLQSDLADVI